MTGVFIRIKVDTDRTVECSRIVGGAHAQPGLLRLEGLDYQILRHFARWLARRDMLWDQEEVRTFGKLLHRCLLADVWPWLQGELAARDSSTVRLVLGFPAGPQNASVASLPWEYLHTQDADDPRDFLAQLPGVVLSRYVPGKQRQRDPCDGPLSIMPVVADPNPDRLGPVEPDLVLEAIGALTSAQGFKILPTVDRATRHTLRAAVREHRPDLVHFIGHGDYDHRVGRGRVALVEPGGGEDWVDEYDLTKALCADGPPPRGVVLHACDGGQVNFADRFAGLAPELIRNGVQCVIAMQYPVTPESATAFSTSLYEQLAQFTPLDVAVQRSRQVLVDDQTSDPRLVGVPVLYQCTKDPLSRGSLHHQEATE